MSVSLIEALTNPTPRLVAAVHELTFCSGRHAKHIAETGNPSPEAALGLFMAAYEFTDAAQEARALLAETEKREASQP